MKKRKAGKIFAALAVIGILSMMMPVMGQAAALPKPVFSMSDVMEDLKENGSGFTKETVDGIAGITLDGEGYAIYDDFHMDLSKPFTISVFAKTAESYTIGYALIFARNDKVSGHLELYLENGRVQVYTPDLNANNPIVSSVNIIDGKMHAIAVSYDGMVMKFYDNGILADTIEVGGAVANVDCPTFSIGADNFGTLMFPGFIGELHIYDSILTDEAVAQISDPSNTEKPLPTQKPGEDVKPPSEEDPADPKEPNVPSGDTALYAAIPVLLFAVSAYSCYKRKIRA